MKSTETKNYSLQFKGNGGEYFVIAIINWLLTTITLSLYYPWAKEKKLKYYYSSTLFNGDRFSFTGTGKEMFVGYIKTLIIFGVLFGGFYSMFFMGYHVFAVIFLYLGFFVLVPFAVHGSMRYRMSRTSWRGIRFGYKGVRNDLLANYIKWSFLTLITLGIYGFWMQVKLQKYLISNVKVGDASFDFNGKVGEFVKVVLLGYLLTIITLGIYVFWWENNMRKYYIENMVIEKDDTKIELKWNATGLDMFVLLIVNSFIILFTLGIGFAWVEVRTAKFMLENIGFQGNIDLDALAQKQDQYRDATGEDMSDFMDIDFIF